MTKRYKKNYQRNGYNIRTSYLAAERHIPIRRSVYTETIVYKLSRVYITHEIRSVGDRVGR